MQHCARARNISRCPTRRLPGPKRLLLGLHVCRMLQTLHVCAAGTCERGHACMQRCDEVGYMAIGLAAAVPCVALPWALGGPERGKPLGQRYWVKANLWVALFSFVGNYFWTHYFYELLGAAYTFPSWRLNGVRGPPVFRACRSRSMRCQRQCTPAWRHAVCGVHARAW